MKATFYSKSKQTLALLLLCFGIVTLLPAQITVTQAWANLAPGIYPHGIAIDVSGNVYTANFNNTVSKVTPTGVVTHAWATLNSNANPYGIAISASGNVYTSNSGNNTVSRITSAGVVTQSWAVLASGAGVRGIAIDASGNVYTANLSNKTVSKITSAGVVTQSWAVLAGAPFGITVDALGNVYTANFNSTVSKITPTGVVTQSWAALASGATPYDIAIDVSGNVYTANYSNNTVSQITSAGVVTQSWAALASGASPFDIVVDASGNVYTVNQDNSTISKICTTTVTPSVAIAITTGSQTTCAGASVTFTATPTNGGTTPTYQWRKNGANISGATSATYTSTTLANNDTITCALTSNEPCAATTTATSNSLTMTVNPSVVPSVAIAITTGSQTTCAGASVTFTATPTNGGTTPTYQWRNNGTNISGATNATFTSTTLANTNAITCVLTSNANCRSATTATSNSLTMTVPPNVTPSVTIAITAGSQTISSGASVTFTATPTNGGTAPTYQWRNNGTNISGATNATYTSTAFADNDAITCVLTSNACVTTPTTTSNSLTMTVTPSVAQAWASLASGAGPVGIAADLSGNVYTVNFGTNTVSKITPVGVVTQAWAVLASGASPYHLALDASGNVYTANYGNNTVSKITPAGVVTQAWATLAATAQPYHIAINAAGDVFTANYGNNTISKITSAGVATLAWATLATGALPRAIAIDASGNLYVANRGNSTVSKITSAGVVTQAWATLAATATPRGIVIDASGNLYTSNYDNNTVSKITSAGAVTQAWATMVSGAGVFRLARDASGNIYTANYTNNTVSRITSAGVKTEAWATLASNANPWEITVDALGNVYTANYTNNTVSKLVPCTTTVTPSVAIAVTTGSQTTCVGASVTFTATPTNGGTTPTYQWRKNGTNISGATSATYTSTTLANNDSITCVLTSNVPCATTPTATSNSLTMTVNPIVTPSVIIAASATNILQGASVTFTATPTNGGTTPTYQWQKGGVNISGATNATYTSTTLANSDTMTCIMTSNAPCASAATATSNAIAMTVTSAFALNFDGTNDHVALPAAVYFNGNLTIEAWVYPKSHAAGSRIIDFGNDSTSNNVTLTIAESGNDMPKFSVDGREVYATKKLVLNSWSHIAVTLNGTTATFYINGVASGTGTINTPPDNIVRNNCYIGGSNRTTVPYANASMDEVRIWNRALPQCEIQNNMNGELGSGQTGLVAYYKFNQGSANSNNASITTLTDASGNNYHGTLNGFGLTGTSSNWVAQGGVAQGAASPTYTLPSVSVSNATTCINTPATLTATLSGFAATATYLWETSTDNTTWRVLAGATTTTYSPASNTAGTFYYRIKVTDVCGVVYATGATFTVINHRLTVTADATRVCQNSVATLTAATVTGSPTYQWQSSTNGSTWANVSGATSATFVPTTSIIGVAYYRVVASYGSGCTLNSTPQILTVGAAPTVAATGGNVTVGQGSTSAKLTGVINAPYASVFQWQSSADGLTAWTDIADADGLTYQPSTANVGTLHYRLKVSFAATGSVCNATIYSNIRRISVTAAPSVNIVAVPNIASGAVYCSGTSLSLNSTCSDIAATPIWTGPNGFTASTANISFSKLSAAQAGEYRVTYLTETGNLGEKSFFINIEPELVVAKTVSATAVVAGNPAQIAVTGKYKGVLAKLKFDTKTLTVSRLAEGAIPTFGTDNGSINQQWVLIPVSSDSLDLNPSVSQRFYIQSLYSGLYLTSSAIDRTIVTMAAQRNSPNAEWYLTRTNNGLTSLRNSNLYQFDDKAVKLNTSQTTQTFNLVVTPLTPNPSLAWENASTGATRTVSPTATTDYIATFTNSRGCMIKDTTSIAVLPGTTISIVPSGDIPPAGNQQRLSATNVCQGRSITLTATVSNNGASPTYQWQRSTNGTTWFDNAGETLLTYNPLTILTGTTFYRGIVKNSLGTFISAPAEIFVIAVPTVSVTTTNAIVCQNIRPTLTAEYTAGFGTPTIQWQSSPDSTTWTNIATATASTYQPVTTTTGKIYYRYIATFTGSCPTFTSKGLAITVKPTLTVNITGVATQTVCQGSYRFFTLSSNDATATYSWQSSTNGTNWIPIANETSASYVAPTSTVGTTHYRGAVSVSGCGITYSATRQITVNTVPTVTVASPYTETCVDRPVSFKATLSSTSAGTPTFVWQTSNDNLNWATKATGSTYSPSTATVGSTYVRAGVKFASCTDSTFSLPQTLVSNANPIITMYRQCGNANLTVQVNGGLSQYKPTLEYRYNNTEPFQVHPAVGSLNSITKQYSFNINGSSPILADTMYYRAKIISGTSCPSAYSQELVVLQTLPLSVNIAASSTTICQGSKVSLTSTTSAPITDQTLQWQSSPDGTIWTDIAGATTASYNYTSATVGSTKYRLIVQGLCTQTVSNVLTIVVASIATAPTLAIAANNLSVCGTTEMVVTATSANLSGATPQYEWWRNGELFTGIPLSFVTKTMANGLGSNVVNDIFIDKDTVFLATNYGLAISTDFGKTFTNKIVNNGDVRMNYLKRFSEGGDINGGASIMMVLSKHNVHRLDHFRIGTSDGLFNFNYQALGEFNSIGYDPSTPRYTYATGSYGGYVPVPLNQQDKNISFIHHIRTKKDNYAKPHILKLLPELNVASFRSDYYDYAGNIFNSIVYKPRNLTAISYWLTPNGLSRKVKPLFQNRIYDLKYNSQKSINNYNCTRMAFRGDTLFVVNATNGLNYYIEGASERINVNIDGQGNSYVKAASEYIEYSVTGLPAANTIKDVLVQDNLVYVTATSGLYLSKDGGKSFSDITSSVGLEPNPDLGYMVRSGNSIFIASSKGLRIASPSNQLKFSANKSDLIECRMTTTAGCTNTVSQSLTVNYINDVDPTTIKVAVDGTTGTGTWTAVNSATGYGWELSKFSPDRSTKTFVKNGTVTTNKVTLTDLNPSTNYELTVKTLCNISQAFARLADVTGTGAGGSTSFTTGFVVPQAIKDALAKASNVCAEDSLILGPGFPFDYQVNIYSGTDKSYIDFASFLHPFKVKLTANTKYFYKVVKLDAKSYTFTSSNNDAGTESKRYTVPTGVSKIIFEVGGSKGGGSGGGNGGVTIGTVTPTAGTVYYLFPGTTTTSDAGLTRNLGFISANGGGGSYVSTTSLRKDALLVAGGGGGGSPSGGGTGGQIGGHFSSAAYVGGGTATKGGASARPNLIMASQITPSGFMKGGSTNNVTSSSGSYVNTGGGGGYYGGGSCIDVKAAGGGGGSSYANTTIVQEVQYRDGTNTGTGYVTVYEYAQGTANSDFLPLDIVLSPVPVLANPAITLNPAVPVLNQNFQATLSFPGNSNSGFTTSYSWFTIGPLSNPNSNVVTLKLSRSYNVSVYAKVAYCSNRQKTFTASKSITFSGNTPPDSNNINGNRLLTPSVSIASSATNICGGEQVIITATPTNVVDENLFYTWRKNGVDIIGESNNVLQTSSLSNGDVITCTLFYPTVTGEIDSAVGTNSVTMTVATPATPKVTIAASVNDVCPGTAITFTPTPTNGGTSPQYRWYLNGDLVQTSPTYTSSSFENSDYVECIMESNATCLAQTESEISTSVSVNLKPLVTPTATVFVLDTLICSSGTTRLSVQTEAAGTTPQYQWRHNGAAVGNNVDYAPVSVAQNDAIWCEVTPSADACANTSFVQSNTELIQKADADAVFTPLATITVDRDSICTGDSLTFFVEGNYLGNTPSYVWKKNGTMLDSTNAFITLANIANGDIITCIATSSLSCVSTAEATSNALTAKVVTPATPIVSISTPNTTICPNIPVVITATPTYGGTFPVYNWRLNGTSHNALPHEFLNDLVGSNTNAVFVRNDTVFAATAGGVSYRINGDSLYQTLSYDKGLATSNVQAIYVDDSGVYAGTDEGLSISTDGLNSFRPINTARSGLSSSNITAITAIGSTLFVGTDNGLNISTDGGNSFTSKKTTEGLASNRIRHLFVDGTTLYVGTEGGLNITTNNGTTFTTKTIADSLNSDTVLGVWAKGAAIYAATQQGLAVSNDGGTTFTKLTMENGLPNLQVNGVWVVADSMVYAATSGGLGISKNGGKTFRGYYETDSLGSNNVLGVTVAGGRIYAATASGLSVSDPSKIRVYPNDGDVFATNLASNKSCVATSTATSNNLTFFVGAVSAESLDATIVRNTSATLTWTGTVGSYNWLVVPTGTGLGGTVVASGSTTTLPISVTGLTALTTYDLFVQGACTPEGTVDWVGPLTFTTKDDAFVSVKTILQGAYSTTTGLMGDNLRSLNLIPTTEPYTGIAGFTHVNGGGGEKVTSTVLAVTGNNAIVDWVFVELRDKTTPTTVIATRSALIQRDGDVVDVDGVSPVGFNVMADDYYIVVRHRNHLGIRTASVVSLNKTSATPYDFTTAANQALNSVQKDLTGGKFGMYAGDVNADRSINATDRSNAWNNRNLTGYRQEDCNLNGTVDATDRSHAWNNRNISIIFN